MYHPELPRREFLKMLAATYSATAIDWDTLPYNTVESMPATDYDAIIIGAGLAGLSCAAACARQGFKPLLIEQHDKPGGYATAFTRPGGFGNYRGAVYGWDQTVNNSGANRVGHSTPIKNLYLAGAWSRPGHGYGAVIPSGLECFAAVVKEW
jgi:phytoene dehydrogenase-like protein